MPARSLRQETASVPTAVARFLDGEAGQLSRVLVALSGGPDSVALLMAMADEAPARGLSLFACWVDHGIRPEAEIAAERAFVEELCRRLSVPLSEEIVPRGAITGAPASGGGVESVARRLRYEALERARAAVGCDLVLTAHNADDFLETMVMRLFTGSGSAGLRGIPRRNGFVARPLLDVTKAAVYGYLREKGQGYRVDSTNEADDYLRNRVRHDLMPVLLSVFPALRSSLETLAAKAAMDEVALSSWASSLVGPEGARLEPFDAAPEAVRLRVLYALARGVEGADDRPPFRLVLEAARSAGRAGSVASGAGLTFLRSGGLMRALPELAPADRLSRRTVPRADAGSAGFSLFASGPGTYRIGKTDQLRLYYAPDRRGIRADAFSWPLWVRSSRPGDSLSTRVGQKPVDALLGELLVEPGLRSGVPVVEDADGILAVLASLAGGSRDAYRRNDALEGAVPAEYLVIEKGAASDDAVRR